MNSSTVHSKAHLLRRVFVWELPVRYYHWINALCIMSLIGTGLIIGNPPAILSGKEAYAFFWFGTVYSLCLGIYLFVQLYIPIVLGLCGKQVRELEELYTYQ